MVNNNIAVEVKRARLANILNQVDHHLSDCGEPSDNIVKLYHHRITREIPEELKKVFHKITPVC